MYGPPVKAVTLSLFRVVGLRGADPLERVEAVHRDLEALLDRDLERLDREVDRRREARLLAVRDLREQVSRRLPALGRAADADADARKVGATDGIDDRAQAVVPAVPALLAQAQLAARDVHLVEDDDEVRGLDGQVAERAGDRLARQVHEGLGLEQADVRAERAPARELALELGAERAE